MMNRVLIGASSFLLLSGASFATPFHSFVEKNVYEVTQNGKTITGIITDQYGPVTGANVVIKGTTQGTITDIDGKFSLDNVSPSTILQVSYIGYMTQEIKVGNQTNLNIQLKEDSQSLDELVVVGYGVQKKADLSGAVATVPTEVLMDRPVVNVGQALQGSVANMNVTIGSGQATDSPSFNIRGTTSLNGGDPLVVIDGVVSSAEELNRMNPTDIGSISVLKDAASSAIYGSRAAFGVILVTTKTAGQEKLTINYNNNWPRSNNSSGLSFQRYLQYDSSRILNSYRLR